ncbi:MAG: hypothetical protein ACE5H3_10985 [Planctomycetota bacterium]
MADHGHYQAAGGTRQGIYVMAPGGRLLSSINALDPHAVQKTLEKGLAEWNRLPGEFRKLPAGLHLDLGNRWETSFPKRGLVLVSFNRDLPADNDPRSPARGGWNRDHVWFSPSEVLEFLPQDQALGPGTGRKLPRPLVDRLVRFHLVDNVNGQTLPFAEEEVQGSWIISRVEAVKDHFVFLRLAGRTMAEAKGPWLMGRNDWTPEKEWPRGIKTALLGKAVFDLRRKAFTAFELVAKGVRWGRTQVNGRRDSTPGPIGFYFNLAPDRPSDRVAPAFIDLYNAGWVPKRR